MLRRKAGELVDLPKIGEPLRRETIINLCVEEIVQHPPSGVRHENLSSLGQPDCSRREDRFKGRIVAPVVRDAVMDRRCRVNHWHEVMHSPARGLRHPTPGFRGLAVAQFNDDLLCIGSSLRAKDQVEVADHPVRGARKCLRRQRDGALQQERCDAYLTDRCRWL
jgi:hypothetical protein